MSFSKSSMASKRLGSARVSDFISILGLALDCMCLY